ncbi:unnamed protein product [Diatraea saccharalis]|uniref:Uncharacterized protein n=1 Tax=Diatraea saccharalis TaxID=40085 RepID=A0A9N9R0T5_9NEOP|nr:unnamed protein product [Diatraea saccharalis]
MQNDYKMLKYLSFGIILIAAVSAVRVNFPELDNFIEPHDAYIPGLSLPYPYQDNRVQFVDSERYNIKRYEPVVVPVPTVPATDVVVPVVKSGLISSCLSFAISLAGAVVKFIIKNALALIIGTFAAIGVCKLTPICNKLSSINSFTDASRDLSIYATPERIARAAEFIDHAIKKYRSYQNQ